MATRSSIGIEDADGTIRSVYCHNDGYLGHVGETLRQHYADRAKVEELIALGGLSSLAEDIGVKHDFDWMGNEYFGRSKYDGYRDDPRYNMVCAYHRDRGEPLRIATSPDRAAFLEQADRACGAEYAYLFTDAGWLTTDLYDAPNLIPFDEAFAREAAEEEDEDA
jgi:hypothetical protein